MKNVMASAGLIALGAVGVQNAHAQLSAGTDKPWSVSGTLRGFYDDNYSTQPSGPLKRDSFGFELRPSAALSLDLEQTKLTSSYLYSMKYFDDRPRDKADHSHDFELFLNHSFTERYSVELSDSFVIAQEPDLINPSNPGGSPLRLNGNNIRNNAGINFRAKLTDLLTAVLGYNNTVYSYDQHAGDPSLAVPPGSPPGTLPAVSRSGALDRMEQQVTLNTRWQVLSQTAAVFGYQFGAVNYTSKERIVADLTATRYDSSVRDNHSHYAYTGLDHNFRPDLSASVRVGVQTTDYYNDPKSQSSIGPYADLNVTYKYMEEGSFMLGFTHHRSQTDLVGGSNLQAATLANLTLDSEASTLYASLTHKITPSLTGTLTGQYQHSDYKGGGISGGDDFYLFGANLSYQFTHNFSSEIGYNYDKLESNAHPAYDRNRVYVGLTASY